jgi:hypothetical protein
MGGYGVNRGVIRSLKVNVEEGGEFGKSFKL